MIICASTFTNSINFDFSMVRGSTKVRKMVNSKKKFGVAFTFDFDVSYAESGTSESFLITIFNLFYIF